MFRKLLKWGATIKRKPWYKVVKWLCAGAAAISLWPSVAEYIRWRYTLPRLTITVLPTIQARRQDLAHLATEFGLNRAFSLNLDDPIESDYFLLRFQARTGHSPIEGPIALEVSTGAEFSKILDTDWRVIRPQSKHVEITTSIPKLYWVPPRSTTEMQLSWSFDDDTSDAAGFNVYQSLSPDSGFGRINAKVITATNWTAISAARLDAAPRYYRISTVSVGGLEGELGSVLQSPNLAGQTGFSDDPHYNDASPGAGKIALPENDVAFVRGHLTLSLEKGLDSNANIEFVVLCKLVRGSSIAPSVSVKGPPNLLVTSADHSGDKITYAMAPAYFDNDKIALTVPLARAIPAANSIYVCWEKPKAKSFSFVRIFRAPERQVGVLSQDTLGEQIYQGPGQGEGLSLETHGAGRPSYLGQQLSGPNEGWNTEPPPSTSRPLVVSTELAAPSAPHIIDISTTEELKCSYFQDTPPDAKKSYTYTIYGYDNQRRNGYPVVVNISAADTFDGLRIVPKPTESVANRLGLSPSLESHRD